MLEEDVAGRLLRVDADAVCARAAQARSVSRAADGARAGARSLARSVGVPLVMMAEVCGGTLNSSATYLSTAVNGAASGTLTLAARARGGGGASGPDARGGAAPRARGGARGGAAAAGRTSCTGASGPR